MLDFKIGTRFAILLLVLFLSSCRSDSSSKNYKKGFIDISQVQFNEDFSLGGIFEIYELIKLKNNKQKLIGRILKVIEVGDCFIILYQFNNNDQRYIQGVKKNGDISFTLEPEESNFFRFNPRDITLFSENTFEVLEVNSNSIIRFDENGKLLKSQEISMKASNFVYDSNNDLYAFHKNSQAFSTEDTSLFYNLIFTDKDFNIVYKYFPFSIDDTGERFIINFMMPLQEGMDGKIYCANALSDSIYCFQRGQRYHQGDIVFDMPSIKSSLMDNANNQKLNANIIKAYVDDGGTLLAGWFIFSDNLLSFNFVTKDGPAWGIFNFKTNDILIGYNATATNSLPFPSPIGVTKKGAFVSYLNEFSLQYVPEVLMDIEFINNLIQKGDTYLIIAK